MKVSPIRDFFCIMRMGELLNTCSFIVWLAVNALCWACVLCVCGVCGVCVCGVGYWRAKKILGKVWIFFTRSLCYFQHHTHAHTWTSAHFARLVDTIACSCKMGCTSSKLQNSSTNASNAANSEPALQEPAAPVASNETTKLIDVEEQSFENSKEEIQANSEDTTNSGATNKQIYEASDQAPLLTSEGVTGVSASQSDSDAGSNEPHDGAQTGKLPPPILHVPLAVIMHTQTFLLPIPFHFSEQQQSEQHNQSSELSESATSSPTSSLATTHSPAPSQPQTPKGSDGGQYAGLKVPLRNPIVSRGKERQYFDSADWAISHHQPQQQQQQQQQQKQREKRAMNKALSANHLK